MAQYKYIPKAFQTTRRWIATNGNSIQQAPDEPHKQFYGRQKQPINNVGVGSPEQWRTFDELATDIQRGCWPALCLGDGLHCLDLDHTLEQDSPNSELHWKILNALNGKTYIELSSSGAAFHIFLFGDSSRLSYRKKQAGLDLELYNKDRYIIMTGELGGSAYAEPAYLQEELESLAHYMGKANAPDFAPLWNTPYDTRTVDSVIQELYNTDSDGLFKAAMNVGTLEGYTDASSMDVQLWNRIASKTDDINRAREIFMRSKLATRQHLHSKTTQPNKWTSGKREALLYTELKKALQHHTAYRAKQERMQNVQQQAMAVMPLMRAQRERTEELKNAPVPKPQLPAHADAPRQVAFPKTAEFENMNRLYSYYLDSAAIPVPIYGVYASLLYLNRFVAHFYDTPTKTASAGLYALLVGESGSGKEGPVKFWKRLDALVRKVKLPGHDDLETDLFPDLQEFHPRGIPKSDHGFASGFEFPTRHIHVPEYSKFQTKVVKGEPQAGAIQKAITDIFSGGAIYGARAAKEENSVQTQYGVALTLTGDTVPSLFNEIDPEQLADGTFNRALIMAYTGAPVDKQIYNRVTDIPGELQEWLIWLFGGLRQTDVSGGRLPVGMSLEARNYLRQMETDNNTKRKAAHKAGRDSMELAIVTRDEEKIIRVATTLAVATNAAQPEVSLSHIQFAQSLVEYCTHSVLSKFQDGTIADGNGDVDKRADVILLREFHKDKQCAKHNMIRGSVLSMRLASDTMIKKSLGPYKTARDKAEMIVRGLEQVGILVNVPHEDSVRRSVGARPNTRLYYVDASLLSEKHT